jgi:hypothetical protein
MIGRSTVQQVIRDVVLSYRGVISSVPHRPASSGLQLLEVLKQRQDKSALLKHLSAIRKYDEAALIADIEKDPSFFRFLILDSTMRVFFYAYHLAIKEKHGRQP